MAVRKRATQMTGAEKERFRNVITASIQSGTYGQLVAHHADMMHNMHGGMGFVGRQRFLPWHRVYLLRLEEAMQAIDPLCFIPYWRWTTQRSIPSWLRNFRPTVNVPGQGNVTVTRNPGVPPILPTTAHVNDVLSETTYTDFTTQVEFIHNDVHGPRRIIARGVQKISRRCSPPLCTVWVPQCSSGSRAEMALRSADLRSGIIRFRGGK